VPPQRSELIDRVIAALLWAAAFSFAVGVFLSATLLLRGLPPTAPVAIGRVTVERVSKTRDYAAAALFFAVIAPATIALYRAGTRQVEAFRRASTGPRQHLVSILFVAPFFLAPFLYLTTFKWGWPVLIPLLASQLGPRAVIVYERNLWVRRLFHREMVPFHALLITEAVSWIVFRYIEVGRRIAHVPTLFLEVVFAGFFIALFWIAVLLIARLATLTHGMATDVALQRLSIAALPFVVLPELAVLFAPAGSAIALVMIMVLASIAIALRRADPVSAPAVRTAIALVIVPALLYCISYASMASLAMWIDLFHRGESLGPASDYLRGKVPYRDVFVLHGLLEDGMLDAWLMDLFGRRPEIVLARPAILGSFAAPALWYLGMVIFDSMPLSMLIVLLNEVTTVDNERALFEITALALLVAGIRRRSQTLIVVSGIVAGVAIFFSLDIGLYSVGGGVLTLLILWRWKSPSSGPRPAERRVRGMLPFLIGVMIGAAPFVVYLIARGAFQAFLTTSFITIPRIIDAVWSLPFPDLTTTFRRNLNLHTISDFFLFERFRFVLNPLVIGIALVCLIQRAIARKNDPLDVSLLVLTVFAILTQRSALGRADFPHQYFSAFLIGPTIVILLLFAVRAAARIWRSGDSAAQAFLCLTAMVLLPLFAVALWVPDIANARLDDIIHYKGRVSRIGFVDPAAEEIRQRIDQVRYFVWQYSRRGDPIYDFSNQPAFYFFCERPNPTRFYQVPILSPPEFQRETILALDLARPPVVIRRSPQRFDEFDEIDNSVRAQAVAGYINDYYSFANSTRGVELWTRKRDAPRLNLEGYMRQIRLPSLTELGVVGSRSRILFPLVGSLPGATGTYWRSDLTLHNPFPQRMSLGLRYVADNVRVDRTVVLGGGQSIRWEDVVRTLFHAPEGRGVLWIEYHGSRPPLARVKTFDAAHDARPSINTPLSIRDAATATAGNNELTIVGIPAGSLRRVNIGIVNVGEIPATFRITLRTRTGQRVGGMLEEGLAEEESYLLTDAETALGVRFDETMNVRITMVAGTAIAYAAVVEANGDSQFLAAVPSQQP
jgi:hypothetical protein